MKNILSVAKYTVIEVYRSKLLVSLIFLAFGLVLLSYVASEFAYGAPAKIALDVGMGIMSLSNLTIAIFIGATLLSKEINQRTLYMIISRPISRVSFIFGKIMGLSSVLLLNSCLLGGVSYLLFVFYGGSFQELFVWTFYFSFFEALIILLFAVIFSLVTNTTLSVVFTIVIFVVGHSVNETSKILFTKMSPLLSAGVELSLFALPNLYRLNLKDFLLYQQNISQAYLLTTQLYVALYVAAQLALIGFIFRHKNLD